MNGAQDNDRHGLTDQSNLSSGTNNVDLFNDSGMGLNFHCAATESDLDDFEYFFFVLYLPSVFSIISIGGSIVQ